MPGTPSKSISDNLSIVEAKNKKGKQDETENKSGLDLTPGEDTN